MALQPSIYVPILLALALSLITVPVTWNLIWPPWKRYGKLAFSVIAASLLSFAVGWWALVFVVGHPLIGFVGHIWWCRKHGFNWMSVNPEAYRASQQAWAERLAARQRET